MVSPKQGGALFDNKNQGEMMSKIDRLGTYKMKLFCKHEYKLLSETITKSKFEVTIETLKNAEANSLNIPWQLADVSRKHIQVFICDKCGKLKRFVEEI